MTAVPFPPNRRAASSPQTGVTCPGAPPPAPGQGLSPVVGERALSALRNAGVEAGRTAFLANDEANRLAAMRARMAEVYPDTCPEPDIPAAWWAPLFWIGALMLGAAIWTAVLSAALYLTRFI